MTQTPIFGDAGHGPRPEDIMATPRSAGHEPDAHGQAALLLVESLIHALVERRFFTPEEALSVTCTACEVKEEYAQLSDESAGRLEQSMTLLRKIEHSLTLYGRDHADRRKDGAA